MAIAFGWQGSVDTDLPFSAFWSTDHTVVMRFMPQYPNAYAGPIITVLGQGDYVIGQGDFNAKISPTYAPSRKVILRATGARRDYHHPLTFGRWHHLAVVRSGATLTLYLDGQGLFPPLTLNGFATPTGTLRLGRRGPGLGVDGQEAQFYGMVDEVAVYSRAIPQPDLLAQVTNNAHLSGAEPGLLAGWIFAGTATGPRPATLSRPITRSGDTSLIETSSNWNSIHDARLLPIPANHVKMHLPFRAFEPWRCIQGFAEDPGTHQGYAAFCWDFILADWNQSGSYPHGSFAAPVFAAAPGEVSLVKEDTPPGPPPPERDTTNRVEAKHQDGQVSGYLHLLKNSARPWVGDRLVDGQPLGKIGDETFSPGRPHLHFGVADHPDGTPGFVTIPTAFEGYEIRAADGTWQPVAVGVPQHGDVVRRVGDQLWVSEVTALSYAFIFFVPSLWFRIVSQTHVSALVTITVSRDGGKFHVVLSEDPYPGGSVPPNRVGAWRDRPTSANTRDLINIWWLGRTADGHTFFNENGLYTFRIVAVDPDGRTSTTQSDPVQIRWHGSRITCIRKVSRTDPTSRIRGVGGQDADRGRWELTSPQAIAEIYRGHTFYVEEPTGDRVNVVVTTSGRGHRYLKTVADGDAPNNLLSLPECS
jgi:hypothetical protein